MKRWIAIGFMVFCFLTSEWFGLGMVVPYRDGGPSGVVWAAKTKKKGNKKKKQGNKKKPGNKKKGSGKDKGSLSKQFFDYCETGWLNFDKDLTAKNVKAYCSCESDYLIKTEKLKSQDLTNLQQGAADPAFNDETLVAARIRAFEACRDRLTAKVLKKLSNNTGF